MSAITISSSSPARVSEQGYLKNVACAALGLLNALLAVREPVVQVKDRMALYRLASRYESVSPSLANELRFVAGRD